MWKNTLDRWLLGLFVLVITGVLICSYVIASADEERPRINRATPEFTYRKFIQEEKAWNDEFEKKLSRQPVELIVEIPKRDARHQQLTESIMKLQPRIGENRASRLAKMIIEHADFSKIPHENFIVAIINRESNFSTRVENGQKRGALGEIGLMQVMPRGYAIRAFGEECEQTNAACNIMTGTRYLEETREICGPEDPWVWMSAYGSGKCPSPHSARQHKSSKLARRFFCEITPDCETLWPL